MRTRSNRQLWALGQYGQLSQIPNWGGDPKYPHLSNYLASEVRTGDGSWQAAVLGATAGVVFGAMGGTIGVLVGGLNWPPGPVVSIAGTVAISIWLTVAITLRDRRNREEKEAARLRLGSRGVLFSLYTSAFSGGFEGHLTPAVLERLEEGAKAWWETRSALETPTWRAATGDSLWASAREKASRSVEAAMGRLLILAGEPDSEARQTSLSTVIGEMRAVADQTVRLSVRHYRSESEPGVPGLRDALGELHMLSAAEEELATLTETRLGETDAN